jgi:MFS family permease
MNPPQKKINFLKRVRVFLVVLLSGYIVMALEIMALRIIAVGISGDIFSTGAVIGVVLAALTLGYWLGGTLSVKYDPAKIQRTALVLAGIWIILLGGIPSSPSEFFSATQGISISNKYIIESPWKSYPDYITANPVSESIEIRRRIDPLLVSLVLFFVPSVFLAMIGPCAVKILTSEVSQSGRISGWIFALGSLGSIAGVLVTSFWLIAILGITANLRLMGLCALTVSLFVLNPEFIRAGKSIEKL